MLFSATPETPLPAAVLYRPKTGFSVPVHNWLLEVRDSEYRDRGLRGWAKFLAREFGIGNNKGKK